MLADMDFCSIIGIGLVVALLVAGGVALISYLDEQEQTKASATKRAEELAKQLEQEAQERGRVEREAAAAREAEANAQQLVLAAKQDAERARQAFANAGQDLREVDETLRNGQVLFQRLGKLLTVRVFVVPPTGRTGLQWIVAWHRPQPPRVRISLDGRATDEEHAYQGSWVRTLRRGSTYSFHIAVYDPDRRDRSLDPVDRVDLSVQVPTRKQWDRTVDDQPKLLSHEEELEAQLAEYRKMADAVFKGALTKAECLADAEGKLKGSGLGADAQAMILAKLEAWLAEHDRG